jgi:glycosyltransferase involved in cell wall biosynthesis
MKHVLHVVSLPHTQTTKKYSVCAYTEKVRKFCTMMKSLGNTVFLYASENNEAQCDELITCITKKEQENLINVTGPENIQNISWDITHPSWVTMNTRVIDSIRQRKRSNSDIICIIAGCAQKNIMDAFPGLSTVEFGIGYQGVCAPFMVFESYAWMHSIYTMMFGKPFDCNGRFYDDVIPNFFEVDDFPFSRKKEDYYLYIGRLIERKGVSVAVQACKAKGKKLIIAGNQGHIPNDCSYVGLVGPKERGKLMSRAQAVFVPTLYVEPFGGVAAEALLCGTPVITTDWGAFPENVVDGRDGFRIRTLGEAMWAMDKVKDLDYLDICLNARNRFSTDVLKYRYQDYFDRVASLRHKNGGWDNQEYNPRNKRELGNFTTWAIKSKDFDSKNQEVA